VGTSINGHMFHTSIPETRLLFNIPHYFFDLVLVMDSMVFFLLVLPFSLVALPFFLVMLLADIVDMESTSSFLVTSLSSPVGLNLGNLLVICRGFPCFSLLRGMALWGTSRLFFSGHVAKDFTQTSFLCISQVEGSGENALVFLTFGMFSLVAGSMGFLGYIANLWKKKLQIYKMRWIHFPPRYECLPQLQPCRRPGRKWRIYSFFLKLAVVSDGILERKCLCRDILIQWVFISNWEAVEWKLIGHDVLIKRSQRANLRFPQLTRSILGFSSFFIKYVK